APRSRFGRGVSDGDGIRVTRIPDRDQRPRLKARRQQGALQPLVVESGELMERQAKCRGLEEHVLFSGAEIALGDAAALAGLGRAGPIRRCDEYGSRPRPAAAWVEIVVQAPQPVWLVP